MTSVMNPTSTVTHVRILIVEDEPRIAGFLARGLTNEGADTTIARTGREAIDHLDDHDPALVLLDLSLPGTDGLEVLRHWTERRPEVPVLILSARRDLATRLAGLRAADRVAVGVVRSGATSYDPRTREVDFGGGPVGLSDRESRVFEHLLRERGSVVSRERLLSSVWGYSFRPDTNVVDVCIRRLRAKVGDDRIETVRGAGYRLVG